MFGDGMGLKIPWPQGRPGSIPGPGTKFLGNLTISSTTPPTFCARNARLIPF